MTRSLFADMVALALAQKTGWARAGYLFKGLLFYPFLAKGPGEAQDRSPAAGHTDDIYPLF